MAKKDTTTPKKALEIEYCGPPGETSPTFGALEVGRRYQADPEMAAYLCRTHPEYWKDPASE